MRKATWLRTCVRKHSSLAIPPYCLTNLGNVSCNSLFLGDSLGLGAPLVIHGHFTYSGCVRLGSEACMVTEVSTDSLISVKKTSHESAEITGTGEVNVHCGSFINCTYNGEGLKATAIGPLLSSFENGEVVLLKQAPKHTSGSLCPETAELDIETVPLEKVFFASATAKKTENTITSQLCKADESLCAAGNVVNHVHETTLSGHPAVLLSSVGNILCYALFLGDTLGLAQPLVIHGHFTYGLTGDPCVRHKIFGGTESCTVTEVSTDYLLSIARTTHESAEVTYQGEVNVHCGSIMNCTYNGEGLKATATGPLLSSFENGDVKLTEQTTHSTGGAFCPETGKLDIETMPLEKVYISE